MTDKLSIEHIEAQVQATSFDHDRKLGHTVCRLQLRNGFVVTGEAGVANPANFDDAEGEKHSRARALNKVWELEGYLLKSILAGQIRRLD